MALIELQAIEKRFGGVHALRGVDLSCALGRVHALLGENGAGKSTLIKILTGALQPDGGRILLDGELATLATPARAAAAGIAAVYQEPMIYPHLSVLENLFMGQEARNRLGMVDRRTMRKQAAPLLEQLDIEPALVDRRMSALTIGYQQMILIAQALLRKARLIIFDEPTSILSRAESERLFAIIENLRAADTAVVYITHRLEEIARVADDVTVLRNGAVIGSRVAAKVSHDDLLAMMAGRADHRSETAEARGGAGSRSASSGRPRLEIKDLSVPGHSQDVSWSLYPERVTGIYGLVGSGRSETALAAFGHLRAAGGQVYLDGQPIKPRHPAEAIELGLAYLPEDRQFQGLFADKPLENNLTANTLGAYAGVLGTLKLKKLGALAAEIMARYNIKAADAAVPVASLSGGNQQKALFARWANLELKVLILDEPTRGIDIGTKAEIHRFVRELAARGTAIAVISSDLDEVLAVSDEVIVMRRGAVITRCEGPSMTAETILAAAIGSTAEPHDARADAPRPATQE